MNMVSEGIAMTRLEDKSSGFSHFAHFEQQDVAVHFGAISEGYGGGKERCGIDL
jgi:hypothetical protein